MSSTPPLHGFRATIPRGTLPSHPVGGPACSDASRLVAEPLAATASPGTRWFLVEVAGAWGWNAFADSPVLDPAVGRALTRRAHGAGVRILAIRRPGRARGPVRWRWAVVESGVPGEWMRWGEVDAAEQLLEVPFDGSTGRALRRPDHRGLHPGPARRVLRRPRPAGGGRAGRPLPRGDVGVLPHRR